MLVTLSPSFFRLLLPSPLSFHLLSYNPQLTSTNNSILSVANGVVTAHNPGTARLQLGNTHITTSDITVTDDNLDVHKLDPLPLLYKLTMATDSLSSSPSQSTLTVELLTELLVDEQVEVTASLLPSDGHRVAVAPSRLVLSTAQTGLVSVGAGPYINSTSAGSVSVNVSTQCSGNTLHASLALNITNPSAPVFQTHQDSITVFENVSIGNSVFATNTYLSNAKLVHLLRYSLAGGQQTFSVDSNTGVVRVTGLLDYASVPSYKLNITGTDYRGRSDLLQVGHICA